MASITSSLASRSRPLSSMRLLFTFLLTLAQNVRAFEVGPEFDPYDVDAWEINYGYYPWKAFQSFDLVAPAPRKAIDSPACHDDLYTFITPRGYAVDTPGNAIMDNHGDLVWAQATDGQAYDFTVQEFMGEKYLSYWVGDDRIRGHGQGEYIMLNSSYDEVFRIKAHNDLQADLHELVLTSDGTALMTIYEPTQMDLSKIRKAGLFESNSAPTYIWDGIFQEIDIVSNKLIFEWRASEHYSVEDSYHDVGGSGSLDDPYDFFHINSVVKDDLGNYLISSRYMHSVTYIDGKSGKIIWILGGLRNQFEDLSDGNATDFAWQHDARFHPLDAFPELMGKEIIEQKLERNNGKITKLLTVFDNAAEDHIINNLLSRGILIELTFPDPNSDNASTDPQDYTARFIRSYDHPMNVLSQSQGSMQVIPNKEPGRDPKIMLGYGYNAVYTEFDSEGNVLCDTRFATNYSWARGEVQSYRAFKFPWVGRPNTLPSAVFADDGEAMYVSWNGATEVQRWILEHSTTSDGSDDTWTKLATVEKHGFETELEFDQETAHRYMRVRAVDSHSRVLGISAVQDLGWTTSLSDHIPDLPNPRSWSALKLFSVFLIDSVLICIVYMTYRRFYKWAMTRRWQRQRGIYLYSPVLSETSQV